MSSRVGKSLIGGGSLGGMEWYRSPSVRMAIAVITMKKVDISGGRGPPESGRVLLEFAR